VYSHIHIVVFPVFILFTWLPDIRGPQKCRCLTVSETWYQVHSPNHLLWVQKTKRVRIVGIEEPDLMEAFGGPARLQLQIPSKPSEPYEIHTLRLDRACCGIDVPDENVENTHHTCVPVRVRIELVIFMGQHHDVGVGSRIDGVLIPSKVVGSIVDP